MQDGDAPAERVAFLYDGDNVVADVVNTAGALTISRFYVTPFLDQNLFMTDFAPDGAKMYCYSQDGLGSVRTLTDKAGEVVNRYDYTAFGETYSPPMSESLDNRYSYTGREKSSLASTKAPMFYRNRMYFEYLGRFGQRDKIGDQGRINLYAYVVNNPLHWIDPYGLAEESESASAEGKRDKCKCCCAKGVTLSIGDRYKKKVTDEHGQEKEKWFYVGPKTPQGQRYYISPFGQVGFFFYADFSTFNKEWGKQEYGKCTIAWWEKSTRPSHPELGQKRNEWIEFYQYYESGKLKASMFDRWRDRSKEDTETFIMDTPCFTSLWRPDSTDILEFKIVLKSAEGCDCPQKQVVARARMVVKTDKDGRVTYAAVEQGEGWKEYVPTRGLDKDTPWGKPQP